LKKKLRHNLTLFYKANYPFRAKYDSNKKFEATIGIGGNIGNVKQTFDKLFLCILNDSRFDILATSPLLLNPAFGFLEQKPFLNGIISLKTNLSVNEFFKSMQRLEKKFKRTRSFKDAPRTLDIDIIFFANKNIHTKKLIIPHKHWSQRESVVIPLEYMSKKRIRLF
jgi:2-amino-4-hydroxy-6-hydroxymethyldihydropteridine diphosphokinase